MTPTKKKSKKGYSRKGGKMVEFGWAEMKGRRPEQQDTVTVQPNFCGEFNQHFVGLYDGHAGSQASVYAATHFHLNLVKNFFVASDAVSSLTDTYKQIHEEIDRLDYPDGTAALVVLIQENMLYVANAGDSRAVLVTTNGDVVPLSVDHKPETVAERKRIIDKGGFVTDSKRVNGMLALSRALGDCELQPWVTWMPDIRIHELSSDDLLIILACDGLWDVLTNEEAAKIACSEPDPARAAAKLRDYAFLLGSTDNISVVVIKPYL
eukprot:TRINITY_DN4644_c0_g1_i1.p1 TRINITY_DN4644_c0_g1~~TRINITY_DN4644_c0_g1_i1.p1  ORF type:complete len:265 (-),score=52.13 TRINITY_DN4644_c0_g1_i1:31-825(-)